MKLSVRAVYLVSVLFVLAGILCILRGWEMLSKSSFDNPHRFNSLSYLHNASSNWIDQTPSLKDMYLDERGASLENDFITEEESLLDKPITDIKQTVSLNTSWIDIVGGRNVYSVGDVIRLSITLRNGYNRTRTRGGDKLHVRIYNTTLRAYAPGHVIDHNNGTYTVFVRTFWPGGQTISVYLSYRRETVRALYFIRRKLPAVIPIYGLFKSNHTQTTTLCNPDPGWLTNYSAVCNLTEKNGGMPWFCGKPANLLCTNLWSFTYIKPLPKPPVTAAEAILLKTSWHYFPDFNVQVKGIMQEQDGLPQCQSYPTQLLWKRAETTGFFYNDTWNMVHCKGVDESAYNICLSNTSLVMLGDSTMRQWYAFLERYLECNRITKTWTYDKWHKWSACSKPWLNFTMQWIPHSQPSFMGRSFDTKKKFSSISRYMEQIRNNTNVILVINIYAHFIGYHHSIFRKRMRIISSSMRKLLERNKNVKVLIKGPHTYVSKAFDGGLGDYYGFVYRDIMFEELSGLHDKVIYMDQKDITVARAGKDSHPPVEIVRASIYQMLNYIC